MRDTLGSISGASHTRNADGEPGTPGASRPVSSQLDQMIDRFTGFAKANPATAGLLVGGVVMVAVIALKPKAKAKTLDVRAQRQLDRLLAAGSRSSSNLIETIADRISPLVATAMTIDSSQMTALKKRGEAWLQHYAKRHR